MRWRGRSERAKAPAIPPLDGGRSFEIAVAAGDAARDRGDWKAAADQYRLALARRPEAAHIWVQLGHAVKEAGNARGAESAYRRALALDAGDADVHLQIGHVAKLQGRTRDAITAYAEAVRLDPALAAARDELAALREIGSGPRNDGLRVSDHWQKIARVREALRGIDGLARQAIESGGYPLANYDRFRRDFPVRPPPGPLPEGLVTLVVDASTAAPFLLRETLRSVQDQSVRDWHAVVRAPRSIHDHPVASFAETDSRIGLTDPGSSPALPAHGPTVLLRAGVRLDPEALAWLLFASRRTGAVAVFADHDHGVIDADLGLLRSEPWLYGAYDEVAMEGMEEPALVLISGTAAVMGAIAADDPGRAALGEARGTGTIAHVPRLLGTKLELPIAARGGRAVVGDELPGRLAVAPFVPTVPEPATPRVGRIAVVIPTRDAPGMLARAIESLREHARDPARLDIIVVDNRSTDPATRDLLDALEHDGLARRVAFDGAFNWGLASNEGARASAAPIIVFANNDIEMQSVGWDDRLLAELADPATGAVGIRLLYPAGSVQHAGMVFGLGRGEPEHEGRDWPGSDPGPGRRLVTSRTVAAVTGAFLAVRREAFEAVGGIEAARLTVAHSDIDFCLRLRRAGLLIRYCPAIEAIHHESATRGRNETRADVAWDESERAELVARWGGVLREDPGVSPYWQVGGEPFAGLREPAMSEILGHLDRSALAEPWRPVEVQQTGSGIARESLERPKHDPGARWAATG